MFLGLEEIETILESSLVLDFVKITLKQQIDDNPRVYSGSGSIFQDKDGILQLKMYYSYESGKEIAGEINRAFKSNFPLGKIIEKDHYYSLEAVDMQGMIWKEEYVWLSNQISLPAAGKVIKASLRRIMNTAERREQEDKSKSHALFIIPGKYKIPCNKIEKTAMAASCTICSLKIEDGECEIKKRENHLELSAGIPQGADATLFSNLLLEAISVAIGSFLRPLVQVITNGSTRSTSIFSKTNDTDKDKLQEPIPVSQPDDAVNLNEFVNKYVTSFSEPYSMFFGYWFRILSESSGELENRALVLTTSIQGSLKEYYSGFGLPDSEFLKQVSSASEIIQSLEIGARAKERILSTLENAKLASPKGALYALAKENRIPHDLIQTWVKLRNKSAHADELKKNKLELQEFLNETYGCLELFYSLLLSHIKYVGKFIQYSRENWPASSKVESA
jgi:hypothetical protein